MLLHCNHCRLMKKIDLHVHTKSTVSDSAFVFDLSRLESLTA